MFAAPNDLGLPSIYHPISTDPLPESGGRRIFVGDLQGCVGELEDLLAATAFVPGTDVLLPVGDLVNRGPESIQTLKLLREIEARPVLGNHDLHAIAVREGTRKLSKEDTIGELTDKSDSNDELLRWLGVQPLIRIFPDCYQVHAGLHPTWKGLKRITTALRPAPRGIHFPAKQKAANSHGKIRDIDTSDYVTRTRFTNAKGTWPSKHDKRDEDGNPIDRKWRPWYEFYHRENHGNRRVIYGHWAMFGLCEKPQSLGLDTGCVWGGELTAWIPEEERLVSVKARERWAGNFRPR